MGTGEPLVHVDRVSKRFGHVVAVDDVSVDLRAGTVNVLLGENGAGKSTVLNLISGRFAPDAGEIAVAGRTVAPGDPLAAMEAGIAAVYQEFMLVPTLTALENIRVALRRRPWARTAAAARRVVETVVRRYELSVELDVPVGSLGLAERQRVEIVRALAQEPTVLLLDEATGLLPPDATEQLLRDIRRMADEGLAVVHVTHRISEVAAVGDRVTILRRGAVVHEFTADTCPSDDELGRHIVGASVPALPDLRPPGSDTRLQVTGLRARSSRPATSPTDVDLQVRAGEVLGIAGVDGNGQEQLLEAIAGLLPADRGTVTLDGAQIGRRDYRARRAAGIVYVPGDRRNEGVFPGLSVAENLRIGTGLSARAAVAAVDSAGVWPPDPGARADRLSGGNQQKVVLARSLARRPAVLLLAYPLRGLDVNAAHAIRTLLIEQAAQGTSVVIAWNDVEELVAMCHRWIVMDRGRIVGEQDRGSLDLNQLAKWLAGADDRRTGGRTAA